MNIQAANRRWNHQPVWRRRRFSGLLFAPTGTNHPATAFGLVRLFLRSKPRGKTSLPAVLRISKPNPLIGEGVA
jgi:hypothetical protein